MRKRINPELLAALRTRHGQVFVQALTAERRYGPEPGCLEMLELSEIAHRLRSHVREVIRDCRKREARAAGCTCANRKRDLDHDAHMRRLQVVTRDRHTGEIVGGIYTLYRRAWADFVNVYRDYMKTNARPENPRNAKGNSAEPRHKAA